MFLARNKIIEKKMSFARKAINIRIQLSYQVLKQYKTFKKIKTLKVILKTFALKQIIK